MVIVKEEKNVYKDRFGQEETKIINISFFFEIIQISSTMGKGYVM